MLTREELEATPIDFNLYQKEKDYLQHITLSRIFSRVGLGFTFKGGTSLQKCYGLDRFSEDLDFTAAEGFNLDNVEKSLDEVNRFYPITVEKVDKPHSLRLKLKIEGPLYKGPLSLQTVRVEISLRENVIQRPSNNIITPVYSDLRPYMVVFMNPQEILAGKIRALMTRSKARDLYDTHYLIKKKVKLDRGLVAKKLEFYSMEYNESYLLERVELLKGQWDRELQALVRYVPDFTDVVSVLTRYFSKYNK